MNLQRLLLFIVFIGMLISCKKQDAANTSIRGVVIDYDSQKPMAGVPVQLEYIDGNNGFFSLGLGNYTIGTAATGADGSFDFHFNVDRTRTQYDRYRVSVNHFQAGHRGDDTDLYCNNVDMQHTPLAFVLQRKISVIVRLVHDGPLNADDYISLTAASFPYDNKGGGLLFTANGNHEVQSQVAELTPDHPTIFSYWTKRDGVYTGKPNSPLMDSVVFHNDGEVYTRHF